MAKLPTKLMNIHEKLIMPLERLRDVLWDAWVSASQWEIRSLTWKRTAVFSLLSLGIMCLILSMMTVRLGINADYGKDWMRLFLLAAGMISITGAIIIAVSPTYRLLQRWFPWLAYGLEQPLRPAYLALHFAVLGLVFTIYMLTFTMHSFKFPTLWLFGADSMQRIYDSATRGWGAERHMLFVFSALPV